MFAGQDVFAAGKRIEVKVVLDEAAGQVTVAGTPAET
jgi:hypothetical protein